MPPGEFACQWQRIQAAFLALMQEQRLPLEEAPALAAAYLPLAAWVARRPADAGRPTVLGVNGAQGSGKSTLCRFLERLLGELHGLRVACLSIDDVYRTRAEREDLAREVHPLFLTRGVPGTHDVPLALDALARLRSATMTSRTALPRFDKARDDRAPPEEWPVFVGRPDLILFEGWCVGSSPEPDAALREPINRLEREEDPEGIWRRRVNEELATTYAPLFAQLDALIFLKVPDMDSVFAWRSLQERKLAEAARGGHRIMDDDAIRRFIMHYERLTRRNLAELPGRAELTVTLDRQHRPAGVRQRPGVV